MKNLLPSCVVSLLVQLFIGNLTTNLIILLSVGMPLTMAIILIALNTEETEQL